MPPPFTGPSVWTGADLQADQSWCWQWSSAELAEIDSALSHAKAAGAEWLTVSRETFPLAQAASKLEALADELENGRGFVLLKGLPVAKYAPDDLRCPRPGQLRALRPVHWDFEGRDNAAHGCDPGRYAATSDRRPLAGRPR